MIRIKKSFLNYISYPLDWKMLPKNYPLINQIHIYRYKYRYIGFAIKWIVQSAGAVDYNNSFFAECKTSPMSALYISLNNLMVEFQ